ncbi:MAG: LysR substrate-binding domain-containing protein [Pseudomonadota bacterium]
MRYVQLRAFHHVAVHGGFSRAAAALGLTQPALSDQVRKLEAEYELRLFDRGQKQVRLTPAGEQLLEITHRLFETEQLALDLLSEAQAPRSGRLNIIADSAHHMLHVLGPFRAAYPAIFVSVTAGNSQQVIEALYRYDADIGVVGQIPERSDYQVVKLSSTPIIAFAAEGHPAVTCQGLTLAELADQPLVLRESGSKTRAKIEEAARRQAIDIEPAIEAEGREAVREIVAAGGGIGVVSEAEFGADKRLRKIPIIGCEITMDEAIICLRERRDSKLIRAFMTMAAGASEGFAEGLAEEVAS